MIKKLLFLFILANLSIIFPVFGQNTVGVLLNSDKAYNAYTLFTVHNDTYLINNCGEVINKWISDFPSGKSVYLLENGNLLRAAKIDNPSNIGIAGIGGRIELFDWDNNLLWGYDYTTIDRIQHHDAYPMPNGNILLISTTKISNSDALQMGRNPDNLPDALLYNEQIVEIKPIGTDNAEIVWEWNTKDHVIQDFDNTKDNFGNVSANPQLLDINYVGFSLAGANWMHVNSAQYNADLDQIIFSARFLNEFYILDHSTTTEEAASHTGGTYGKGGDFLYRWGNPLAYRQGFVFDQQLFGQHYPHWIPNGLQDEGKIIVYNNGIKRDPSYSEIVILSPPTDSPGFYSYVPDTAFGPLVPDYTYTAPVNTDFFSAILSSAQRLPNGNLLICEGTSGHFFEIDENEDIVWEYINPIGLTEVLSQGDDPSTIQNSIFRVQKYATDYPAFDGKDLSPGVPIELNPDLSQCEILAVSSNNFINFNLVPNPVISTVKITSNFEIDKIEVFDIQGRKIKIELKKKLINLASLKNGIYFLKIYANNTTISKKIIKI